MSLRKQIHHTVRTSGPRRLAAGFLVAASTLLPAAAAARDKGPDSYYPEKALSLADSHFTWGADIGASIDLGGHNTSSFDVDVNFGYKGAGLKLLGLGAGVHKSFGAGNSFIPIYALLRTSFTSRPSLFFFNLKAGYSFNTVTDAGTKGGVNVSIGVGINLAVSRKFQSHIILSYGYFRLDQSHRETLGVTRSNIDEAQIRFGVNF